MNETNMHNETPSRGPVARWITALVGMLRPTPQIDPGADPQPTYTLSVYDEKIAKQTVCRSCGTEFPITGGELTWLAMKGFPEFKRCKPCRIMRRTQRQEFA